MIAKMQKLHLAAMLSDKDGILDALQKTRAAEVKKNGEEEGTAIPVKDDESGGRLRARPCRENGFSERRLRRFLFGLYADEGKKRRGGGNHRAG